MWFVETHSRKSQIHQLHYCGAVGSHVETAAASAQHATRNVASYPGPLWEGPGYKASQDVGLVCAQLHANIWRSTNCGSHHNRYVSQTVACKDGVMREQDAWTHPH